MYDVTELVPAFKHLTGDKNNICRLCFDATETGVSLNESRVIECFYYDDTITFTDMLTELGASMDSSLPELLCENCADLAMKAFFFKKLSQYSHDKWYEATERLRQALDSMDTIVPSVKTAYITVQQKSNTVATSWVSLNEMTKEATVHKIAKSFGKRHYYRNTYRTKTKICHECGEKIKCKNFALHVKRRHSSIKYPCPKCPKIFIDSHLLSQHEARVHAPKTIPCPKCKKKFSAQETLTNHYRKAHSTKKPALEPPENKLHQCLRCSKIFQNRPALLRHVKICRDDRNYLICDMCGKSFAHKNGLRGHLATVHGFGGKHRCKWCNKRFDALSRLKAHVVTHTGERSHACEQCGGLFVTKAALFFHIRIHTGEKPFSCEVCGEKFLSKSRRMGHMRRKHMEPRHVCSVCGSKFITKCCLAKHVVRHKNPQSKLYVSED